MVSVIIPCRNGAEYLAEAIAGIRAQNVPVEIVLVDDGSTDGSGRLAAEQGCRVIRKEQSEGPVKAKNDALKVISGEDVMFHDCDDVMEPGALARMLAELESDPDVMAVMAKVRDFASPDLSAEERGGFQVKATPYHGLFTGSVLMRRRVWDVLGGFDESVTAGEIIDWQRRMQAHRFAIRKLDFVSCRRRIHRSNFGRTQRGVEYRDYSKLLRAKLLAARRAGGVWEMGEAGTVRR